MNNVKKASEIKWFNVSQVKITQRTINTQLRAVAVQMEESDDVLISVREFSRYRNKEEKVAKTPIDQCPYRQTPNGVTIKQELLGDLIANLTELYDDLSGNLIYSDCEGSRG